MLDIYSEIIQNFSAIILRLETNIMDEITKHFGDIGQRGTGLDSSKIAGILLEMRSIDCPENLDCAELSSIGDQLGLLHVDQLTHPNNWNAITLKTFWELTDRFRSALIPTSSIDSIADF